MSPSPTSQSPDASDRDDSALESRPSSVVNAIPEAAAGFLLHDLEGRILTADQLARDMLGYTWAELVQLNRQTIEPGFQPEAFEKAWEGLPPASGVAALALFRRKDGSTFSVTLRQECFPLGQTKAVCVFFQDLEDRARFEHSVHRTQERLATMLELLPDMVVRIREDGTILEMFTPTQPAFLALPPRHCVGRNVQDAFQGVSVWKVMDFWNIAHETHRVQSFDFKYVRGKDVFFYETRVVMTRDNEAVYFIRDVTMRKSAEEKISELLTRTRIDNEELRRLGKIKDDFLASLSNELRSPITAVVGYLHLLKDGKLGGLNEAQAESLDITLQNGLKLRDMVNNLLDLSKAKSNTLALSKDHAALNWVVGGALEAVKAEADKKHIHLQRIAPPGPVELVIDAEKIERVFVNLLTNAIKFSPAQESIEVGWGSDPKAVPPTAFFYVKDRGPGIPIAKIPHVFEEFALVEGTDTRLVDGVGVGLSLCRRIVEAHHGRIWVESVEGLGATFHVHLPLGTTEGAP